MKLTVYIIFFQALLLSQSKWELIPETNNIIINDFYGSTPLSDSIFAVGYSASSPTVSKYLLSTNGGISWNIYSTYWQYAKKIIVLPNDSKIQFIQVNGLDSKSNDAMKSIDGGISWQRITTGRSFPTTILEYYKGDPNIIYIGEGPASLKRSTDGGNSWNYLNLPMGTFLNSLGLSSHNKDLFFVGFVDGIFRTTDFGNTWDGISLGFDMDYGTSIVINPQNDSIVYISLKLLTDTIKSGVYRSNDLGNTFVKLNKNLFGDDNKNINTVLIDPLKSNNVFFSKAALNSKAIFKSEDDGNVWEPIDVGLPDTLRIEPLYLNKKENTLFAGAISTPRIKSGIYRYSNIVNAVLSKNSFIDFIVFQNYPNPFNPTTHISYDLPASRKVSLKVYDVLGKEVMTLVNKHQESGRYDVEFDASGLSSGMYIYKLTSGTFSQVRKMMFVK